MSNEMGPGVAIVMVRVLDISQLLKEHITDMMLESSRLAAELGFNENCFDMFGYVDEHDKAYLRLEARDDQLDNTPAGRKVLAGSYTTTYKEMTADFLRVWDAGYLCLAPKHEVELLVHAPAGAMMPLFLNAVAGWKQLDHF